MSLTYRVVDFWPFRLHCSADNFDIRLTIPGIFHASVISYSVIEIGRKLKSVTHLGGRKAIQIGGCRNTF
jgi:hypothetical protein